MPWGAPSFSLERGLSSAARTTGELDKVRRFPDNNTDHQQLLDEAIQMDSAARCKRGEPHAIQLQRFGRTCTAPSSLACSTLPPPPFLSSAALFSPPHPLPPLCFAPSRPSSVLPPHLIKTLSRFAQAKLKLRFYSSAKSVLYMAPGGRHLVRVNNPLLSRILTLVPSGCFCLYSAQLESRSMLIAVCMDMPLLDCIDSHGNTRPTRLPAAHRKASAYQ